MYKIHGVFIFIIVFIIDILLYYHNNYMKIFSEII